MSNSTDIGLINSKLLGNFSLGHTARAKFLYSLYLSIGKLGSGVVLPMCNITSALLNFILHVVFVSAKEQVVGINTFWIITPVKNQEAVWNFAFVYSPRNPVSGHAFINPALSDIKFTISKSGFFSNPTPTLRANRLCDIFPKSRNVRLGQIFNGFGFHSFSIFLRLLRGPVQKFWLLPFRFQTFLQPCLAQLRFCFSFGNHAQAVGHCQS